MFLRSLCNPSKEKNRKPKLKQNKFFPASVRSRMICYIAPDRLGDETENEEDRWHCKLSKVTQNVTQLPVYWQWLSKNHQTKMSQNFKSASVTKLTWVYGVSPWTGLWSLFFPQTESLFTSYYNNKSSPTQLQLRLFSSRLSCRELNNFVVIT